MKLQDKLHAMRIQKLVLVTVGVMYAVYGAIWTWITYIDAEGGYAGSVLLFGFSLLSIVIGIRFFNEHYLKTHSALKVVAHIFLLALVLPALTIALYFVFVSSI